MEYIIDFINILKEYTSIYFIVLVLISAFSAKVADWILSGIILRFAKQTKTSFDDKLVDALHKPIYYSVFFLGLFFSVNTVSLPDSFLYLLLGLFKSITVIVWSIAVSKIFVELIRWSSKAGDTKRFIQKRTMPLFDNIGKIAIFGGAVYFILLSWNVDVTGWVASAGILSVVIGFAAKDTLSNLFAGIFIMADAPYKEGDYINLDAGERGYVRSIGIRSTRIMTRDDIEITIPNSVIANSKIVNESGGPHEKERVRITISVSYESDIEQVKRVLRDVAIASPNVCKDPEPRVRFRQFADYGLTFQLLLWIERPEMRGRVIDEINSSIFYKFRDENIEIPYPHHVIQMSQKIEPTN
ncbi:MAG: mechanosensitive ion channel family protein [Candidatus Marinimicrobia bacterium]|nr:mechanosensitive ion channel family protein [Candidatus Neomarinimicrobiota bacterium]MBT7376784.1 mechanosensitive ion channel family protein [Candidatus Neomarinimicrobiota bacterium]